MMDSNNKTVELKEECNEEFRVYRNPIFRVTLYKLSADTAEEVIQKMSDVLWIEGITKEGFGDAILKREKEFPTGLPTNPIGVAIPHTDSCYVKTSQVAFASLEKPVNFRIMGDNQGSVIPVSVVFMLALQNPKDQIDMLQKLVLSLQDSDVVFRLANCSDDEAYDELLKEMNLFKK